MRQLSATGRRTTIDLAQQFGFSPDGVDCMLQAVANGDGRMAQFDHPDFGGHGQWMRGGMTMVGDMFDATLKARVQRLCDALSQLVASEPDLFEAAVANRDVRAGAVAAHAAAPDQRDWWPADLGRPNSAGAQNGMRYAYFAPARRLAVDTGDGVAIYDALDHQISGVAQQQGTNTALTFASQHGDVDIATLPVVLDGRDATRRTGSPSLTERALTERASAENASAERASTQSASTERASTESVSTERASTEPASTEGADRSQHDPIATIEKLAGLQAKGYLSSDEFAAKKTELLRRI